MVQWQYWVSIVSHDPICCGYSHPREPDLHVSDGAYLSDMGHQRPGLQINTAQHSPSWRILFALKSTVAVDVSLPTETATATAGWRRHGRGQDANCDVATHQRWSAFISSYSVSSNDPFRYKDKLSAASIPMCHQCPVFGSSKSHPLLSQLHLLARHCTVLYVVLCDGAHACEQRTTHPASHQPAHPPFHCSLTGRPGISHFHRQRCYPHFRRHKINCSCA